MAAKVVDTNEISLNGVYYPITKPVQSLLASIYPGKVVIGDTNKDSQLRTSIIAWADWRGGLGVNRMDNIGEVNRAWWSTAQLRYKNHLVLPGLVTETTAPSHGFGDGSIGAINEFDNEIYAFWNGGATNPKLYKYNNTNDSWSALTSYATDEATDTIIFTDARGVSYLVFACYDSGGSGYVYYSSAATTLDGAISSTGATSVPVDDAGVLNVGQVILVGSENMTITAISGNTLTVTRASNSTTAATQSDGAAVSAVWTRDSQATQFMTMWDERLWGISNAGQLWYASVIGTEVLDAMLPLPDGYVTALFVARNAAGIPIIYASTLEGLFAHDADNAMWVETQMKFPRHPENGKGTLRWRDSVYIPSGMGIYKYVNGGNSAVVSVVGPDRDDGLPSDKRGSIRSMVGSHNELIVGVDATAAPGSVTSSSIPYQWQSHQGAMVIPADTGYSTILGYNELGWEAKWLSSEEGRGLGAMHVSSAYGKYRLWWGHHTDVYFMAMPSDIINPSEIGDFEYALSATHETPWFNAGQSEVDKLALKIKTEVQGASNTETVKVEYATNYSESYTEAVVSITSDGINTYTFNSGAGTTFRSIKLRLTLNRSTATTTGFEKRNTPDVVSLTLEYRKKLPAKWGHSVQVDLNNTHKGKNSKDLRAALIAAIESTELVEFTYRDDSGGTRNYYVDVVSATGLEFTGLDERGYSTISVMEP